jgi:hypothetical protein
MKRRPTLAFPIIQNSINNHFKNGSISSSQTPSSSCWQFAQCPTNEHQVHASSNNNSGAAAVAGSQHYQKPSSTNDRNDLKIYLIVSFVAIVCYANGIQGDFVHDDIPAITMNKDVIGINPITNVFRNDFWGTPMSDMNSHKSYRPLTTLSFR